MHALYVRKYAHTRICIIKVREGYLTWKASNQRVHHTKSQAGKKSYNGIVCTCIRIRTVFKVGYFKTISSYPTSTYVCT